jgi:hypothetical protein
MRNIAYLWQFGLAIAVVITLGTPACSVDELLDDSPESISGTQGPRKRSSNRPGTRCFETFDKFKRAMEKEGKARRNDGKQWHHIVGQHPANKRKFGEYDLHCTDNLAYVPRSVHLKINGHYSSTHPSGQIVRRWLTPQSFDAQHTYGMQLLREHGIKPW